MRCKSLIADAGFAIHFDHLAVLIGPGGFIDEKHHAANAARFFVRLHQLRGRADHVSRAHGVIIPRFTATIHAPLAEAFSLRSAQARGLASLDGPGKRVEFILAWMTTPKFCLQFFIKD